MGFSVHILLTPNSVKQARWEEGAGVYDADDDDDDAAADEGSGGGGGNGGQMNSWDQSKVTVRLASTGLHSYPGALDDGHKGSLWLQERRFYR